MAEEKLSPLSTKSGILLLTLGGYLTAMSLGGMNAVNTAGARWAWGVVLWIGLLLFAWAILAPWSSKRAAAGTGG